MFGHSIKNCSPFILVQHYSRLSSRLPNYKNPKATNNGYPRANPNLIFQRFRSGVEKEEMLRGIPESFLKAVDDLRSFYCFTINREVAGKIANMIITHSGLKRRKKTCVIEVNPGPGLITQELIKNDIENITVSCHLRCPYFKEWSSKYADKINLIELPKTSYGVVDMYKFLNYMSTGDNWVAIVLLPVKAFLRLVLFQIVKYNWNYYKKVEFFLVLSENVYRKYYRVEDEFGGIDHKFIEILFDTEILDTFKRSDFLPHDKYRQEESYLVHLKRKKKSPLKGNDAQLFYYFLLNVIGNRNRYIMENIESWFPGSGLDLLANGMKVTQSNSDCSTEELLKIFYLIKSLGWNLEPTTSYSL